MSPHILPEEASLKNIDSRLLHMWEAKDSIQKRLCTQRHNHSVRSSLARLNKEIENHAAYITNQQWNTLCDRMEVQMRTPKTWHTIRSLLNPEGRRVSQRNNLLNILHEHQEYQAALLQKLPDLYIQTAPSEPAWPYTGKPKLALDRPITKEVY
ncbi:hypothetical protein HPB48_001586 [Haemaphysalis longicornis]|uniref:Uncharacterized protein n=1 Tax=Haemaphysalis longicornis TaxID=44386 RepID=A0A9J6GAW1_HAELO|nr:hypothetical protein HPB48_001586 [Haemaphysalis longicornis]